MVIIFRTTLAQKVRSKISQKIHFQPTGPLLNNKGMALILTLCFLPLLLSLLVGMAWAFSFANNKNEARKVCIDTLMSVESNFKTNINLLMQLNPSIRKLKASKKSTEAKLRVATHPVVIAALTARLGYLISQLTAKKLTQELILAEMETFKTKQTLSLKNFFLTHHFVEPHIQVEIPIAVEKSDPMDVFSEYKLHENFMNSQIALVNYKLNPLSKINELNKLWPGVFSKNSNWGVKAQHCAVSLKNRGSYIEGALLWSI